MLTKLSNRFYVVTLPGLTAVSNNLEGLDTMFFNTPEEVFAKEEFLDEARNINF